MKIIIKLFIGILLTSCSFDKIIYYEYNGVTISRIDDGNEIYFYYGKCDNENNPCKEPH